MPSVQRVASILLANALLLTAIGIFAAGFFPYKAIIPGLAAWESYGMRVSSAPPFDKVIFMVVDALRSDFVYSNKSNFHFTQSLIRKAAAIPFTGHASPPTITMPRVKAITTGSVPSFVDLVLNFAESDTTSTLATQDSWLAQMRAKKSGKLLMYGDDTWLRLFPGFFDRDDGTTSFFVSDFTEVDNNVTRHIDDELKNDDWSSMTMHYLGLDHIGHKTGPRGPNMPAKQAEMDGIVEKIYHGMETENHLASTVLVLLGDHGMNEGGNHGANSAGEVSTALTFISPKFMSHFKGLQCPTSAQDDFQYYDTVEQSDIAPTLAALLDFPVPKNNLGVVITKLLDLWHPKDRFALLYENARQIYAIAEATFPVEFAHPYHTETTPPGSDAGKLSYFWQKAVQSHAASTKSPDPNTERYLLDFLPEAQRVLSGTASNYDTPKLMTGASLALVSFVVACSTLYYSPESPSPLAATVFLLLIALYSITMFASSYVEEEHQFWYWFSAFYILILFFKASRFSKTSPLSTSAATTSNTATVSSPVAPFSKPSKTKRPKIRIPLLPSLSPSPRIRLLALLLLTSLAKRLHQTGQKHSGSPHDILTQFLLPYPTFLWSLIIATYTLYARRLSSRASIRWLKSASPAMGAIPVLVVMSTLLFKVAFTYADAPELVEGVVMLRPLSVLVRGYPLVKLARLGFVGLAQMLGCAIWYERPWAGREELASFLEAFGEISGLALMMQTRTTYIVAYLCWELGVAALGVGLQSQQEQPSGIDPSLASVPALTTWEISLLSMTLTQSAFFSTGGTNAISTVDLSNAYNGVSGYNVGVVGLLTFVSNWAGPIWWSIATLRLLVSRASPNNAKAGKVRSVVFEHFVRLTVFTAASVASVMVACYVLREHLFIWTVFSPKYLYMVAWTVGMHVVVNGVLGTGLLGMSKW